MSFIDEILRSGPSQPVGAPAPGPASPGLTSPMGPMYTPQVDPNDPYAQIRYLPSSWDRGTMNSWFDSLKPAGFQSKYNGINEGVTPDGQRYVHVTLQQPGRHKYDTMIAEYRQTPDGRWTLVNDPMQTQTRQERSGLRDPRKDLKNGLTDLGVSDRIAEGLTQGPTASAALMVNDIARGARSLGVDGDDFFGRLNREVLRNSEQDLRNEERGATRAALIAGSIYGSGFLGAGEAGGAAVGGSGATAGTTATAGGAGAGGGATAAGGGAAAAGGATGGGAAAGAGAGGWAQGIQAGFNILGGLYGMSQADKAREAMDPFGPYRARYAQLLQQLEGNPGAVAQLPGFRAGVKALESSTAAGGYFGSGNAAAALTEFGGNFYQQELDRLAQLAGASAMPGNGALGAADITGRSMASIGYGIGQLGSLLGG